jgi:hypothetical protein
LVRSNRSSATDQSRRQAFCKKLAAALSLDGKAARPYARTDARTCRCSCNDDAGEGFVRIKETQREEKEVDDEERRRATGRVQARDKKKRRPQGKGKRRGSELLLQRAAGPVRQGRPARDGWSPPGTRARSCSTMLKVHANGDIKSRGTRQASTAHRRAQ